MKQGLNSNDYCHQWCTLSFGQPSRILHADGYVDVSGQMPVFYYHLKDHLGNVRSVITPGTGNQPEILQAMEYFPFGMSFESSIPNESEQSHMPNKHKYNSKEEQEMPGRWLDYGARFYDAQLGRWHSIDPLAEAFLGFTPYHYVRNNPVKLYDINGMADNDWFERQQEIDAKDNAQHDAMFNSIMTGPALGKTQTVKKITNSDSNTESFQTNAFKYSLTKKQLEELKYAIKMATLLHRQSWANYDPNNASQAPFWETSLVIEGVVFGQIYTAENIEIWLGKETLTVDIDYFPNRVHSKVNMIDVPGVDFSAGGRIFLHNKKFYGSIMEIRFRKSADFTKFNSFIKAHDLKKN